MTARPPRQLPLGGTSLVTAVVLVACLALLTFAEYRITSRTLTAEWEQKAVESGRLISIAVQPFLDGKDRSALNRVIARVAAAQAVKSVTIVNAQGIIVADSNNQGVGAHVDLHLDRLRQALDRDRRDITWVETHEGACIRFLLSVITPNGVGPGLEHPPQGAVLVGFDLGALDAIMRSQLVHLALVNMSIFTGLLLLGWLVIQRGLIHSFSMQPDPVSATANGSTRTIRARLDQVYASIPIGLMYIASDFTIERVSQSLALLHGRSVEEHVGKALPSVLPSERWAKLRPIIEQVVNTRKAAQGVEEMIPDPQAPDRMRCLLSGYYPDVAPDGTVHGIHIVTLDITAEKQALQERERDLKELMAKNRELDQMAIRDPLTGLYNRRFFDEALTREWQQFQRSGEAFTVIIMDVDAFKAINDDFGHEAGDRGLQQVAATLKANLRESDLIARVGGDEFAALLPRTDADQSQQVAEKLSGILRTLALSTASGDIPMSLSLGAATVPGFPPVSSAAELLRVADKRMYEAKRLASIRRADAG